MYKFNEAYKFELKIYLYYVYYLHYFYINHPKNRQMLQTQISLEKNIERSLNRLQVFLNTNNRAELIPAFYYSVNYNL